ncbi:MAG: sigma-54-dependent Fis family transcriptional regulator [Deltaproteobacteria bacterium]|nr:sigma-54-dependent Fis family transcriptional regulator [Deltaproteobacteria bacterium]
MKPIVLYIDDDQANLDTFNRVFRFDYQVETALSGVEGLEKLKKIPDISVIVSDQRMPKMTGVEFFQEAQKVNPYPTRIMLTAFTDNEALLKAIQTGHVYDYVVKPWDKEALKKVIDKAIGLYTERIEKIKQLKVAEAKNRLLEEEVKESFNFEEIIGADGGLTGIVAQIKKIAPTNSTILIRGESGTGKELIARAIHFNSPRKGGPFVKVNCAALSPGLLESELFGHEKGAFTGATGQKVGRFELADGGTLFLDEVGDLPEPVQVKILRVLQEKEFERVGGTQTIKTDIRLIAATHQNLEKLIQEKKFREDLFFRINVIPLTVPALRERTGDIPSLARHFAEKYACDLGKKVTLTGEALKALSEYDWPGNVRELSNVIERAVVLADGETIDAPDLSQDLVAITAMLKQLEERPPADLRSGIQQGEAQELAKIFKECRGNISLVARKLELPRSTLVHRLKKFRLI